MSGQKARRSVDVMSFQKMYGLYGLKYHKIQISGDVTDVTDGRTDKQGKIELLSSLEIMHPPKSADEICNRRNPEDKKKTWP